MLNHSELEFTNCCICAGNQAYLLHQSLPFKTVKCKTCGLVYLNPRPTQEKIREFYGSASHYQEWTKELAGRHKMWQRRADELVEFTGKCRGRLLDISCGRGTFLEIMRAKGWEVYGTEFSAYAREYAGKKLGSKVCGSIGEAGFKEGYFDLITLWHVLEHLPDPLGLLRETKRILSEKGILIIAVPNANDFLIKLLKTVYFRRKQCLFCAESKEVHLYDFSVKTLRKLIEKAGFKVLKVTTDKPGYSRLRYAFDSIISLFYRVTKINLSRGIKIYVSKNQ